MSAASPLAKAYADGIVDGFTITLKLVLGTPEAGGEPYRGPVPDELRQWADAALALLATPGDKVDAALTALDVERGTARPENAP